MDAIKLMDAKFSLLLIRRSLVRVQQGEPKKDHPNGWSFFGFHWRTCAKDLRIIRPSLYRLSVAKEVAASLCAAGGR